jgi:signal transduction histidine kinase
MKRRRSGAVRVGELLAAFVLAGAPTAGQAPEPLSLEEANARRPGDFAPAHAGRLAIVKGQVSIRPLRFRAPGYSQIAIQDRDRGLVLEGAADAFDHLEPGHWVEVEGRIGSRAGLPVLTPSRITVIDRGPPPTPVAADLKDLLGFRYLGQYVTAELTVAQLGENSGGVYLNIGSLDNPLKVFAPISDVNTSWSFSNLRPGDKVRATGLASQYCPLPPFNRRFQLVIHAPSDVIRLQRGWMLPPWALSIIGAAAAMIVITLWQREARHRRHRQMLRRVYELGEEILGAANGTQVARAITAQLPHVFGVTGGRLYQYNRTTKELEAVAVEERAPQAVIPVESARRGVEAAVASCFNNRTLLAIPDLARSPFGADDGKNGPRSMLLIPMFAQGEPNGVLQLSHARVGRNFTQLEKLAAQHLGNQIGVALRLLEQRSIREQLFRTEKIAAVGRLISGVVNELQTPLASISSLSDRAAALCDGGEPGRMMRDIQVEAQRAAAIVTRLISFDQPKQAGAEPVDINRILRSLIEFRELEWKSRGIHVRNFLRDGPLFTIGAQAQIEQVFLSLIVHAEQALAEAGEKVISLGTNLMAKRILVEISYSATLEGDGDPFAPSANGQPATPNLGVCRSIIEGHEGHIRLTAARAAEARFEIELPWAPMDAEAPPSQSRAVRDNARQSTALLMEPDERSERQLTALLGARAYRVVPVRSAEEGLDLAQRLRFDVVLCSSRLPGLNWIELMQRTRGKADGFILLTDGYDAQLTAAARGERYFVLSKPVDENSLDYALDHLLDPVPIDARGVVA